MDHNRDPDLQRVLPRRSTGTCMGTRPKQAPSTMWRGRVRGEACWMRAWRFWSACRSQASMWGGLRYALPLELQLPDGYPSHGFLPLASSACEVTAAHLMRVSARCFNPAVLPAFCLGLLHLLMQQQAPALELLSMLCKLCFPCVHICSRGHARLQFDSLALGCLKIGRGEDAEQLFDERDYL